MILFYEFLIRHVIVTPVTVITRGLRYTLMDLCISWLLYFDRIPIKVGVVFFVLKMLNHCMGLY